MSFASTTKGTRGRRLLLATAWYCALELDSYPLIHAPTYAVGELACDRL
jgi:hypothetical protein